MFCFHLCGKKKNAQNSAAGQDTALGSQSYFSSWGYVQAKVLVVGKYFLFSYINLKLEVKTS